MKRRDFLKTVAVTIPAIGGLKADAAEPQPQGAASTADWLARWEKNILGDARSRSCDREMGEELGWLVSPFLSGFYYGYMATRDAKWIDMLIDWTALVPYDETLRRVFIANHNPSGWGGLSTTPWFFARQGTP
ncbi:MAG TPA: hypothetical protein PK373_10730, partial [Sedimentisphaerales bacterium]|nr:hypothetical protein [Sedimentisphaerales bacterium]